MDLSKELVFTNHKTGEALINAKTLAKIFEKTPSHMIRSVDKTISDIVDLKQTGKFPKLSEAHFYDFYRTNHQNGQRYRDILMNKKGFWHVAMKLNGKSATALREMILDEFDEKEAEINRLKKQPLNKLDERKRQILLTDNDDLHREIYKKNKNIHMLNNQLDDAYDKTYYFDKQMSTDALYTVSKIAADYGTSAIKFNKAMIQAHIFYKRGYDYYVRTKYLESNMAVYRTKINGNNSSIHFTENGKWTLFTILKNSFRVTPIGMKGMDFNDYYPFNHSFGEKCKQLTLNKNGKNEVES